MRLSTSLKRNIMEVTVGGILYKFKIRKRRHVLFFEDIIANYIKECEKAGFSQDLRDIGREWGGLITKQLVPTVFKKLPPHIFLDLVMSGIWINLGLMDELSASKNKRIIEVKTKNEAVTRIIGKNQVLIGYYEGILSLLKKQSAECIYSKQTKKYCIYKFQYRDVYFDLESKDKKTYLKLNYLPEIKGFSLSDSLKSNILQLDHKNRLLFRGKMLPPVENTIFHLLSNWGRLSERIPFIAKEFFEELVQKSSSLEEKLKLLKTLMQVMGWGVIKISLFGKPKWIVIEIRNPPYGLQKDKDNWDFLIKTVEGYLWLLNTNLRVTKVRRSYKKISIVYSEKI